MENQKRTTIYDIARKLDLNASSVSRALSGKSNVSETTKALILKTAKELNYRPNSMASNLRRGENRTIGVVVPRINQNYFSNIIAGIEEVTYQKGYNLIICQSNESYEREVKCVDTLINQHVSCIFLSISADFENNEHLKSVAEHGINLVQFDRVDDSLDTYKVLCGNEEAAFEAVSHLIEQGYKRIALLEGPQNLNIFKQRKAGYLAALSKHGFPIIENLIIENAWTRELGANATKDLLSLPEPPDAIFASTSDFAALGVLDVAQSKGIKVPQELGICGFSNEEFTQITQPSLTTIDQFSKEIGKNVANLYFQKMKKGLATEVGKIVNIKPQLIIRNSTLKNSV
ncbi:LacI family DNA-binding transcriptional regulator [Pedobacter arcticus]|uniref:LacI family DNA-binding transcriptional regulator n=1 Tax=Pedobacter arcticus TaxID=752140 RepID=UPI00037B685B|nr:LacI family DNA-binding transcriptional regulator [Pedobacter arcticus]